MATRAVDEEFARRRARTWLYVIVAVLLGVGIASAVRADEIATAAPDPLTIHVDCAAVYGVPLPNATRIERWASACYLPSNE